MAVSPDHARRRLRFLWIAALGWVFALLLQLALFEFVGETAWPVVLLLYLPRFPWILPALVLLPFALRRRRRALLAPLLAGALLWLFPFMGFVLPRLSAPPPGPTVRVLSYNTTHGVDGPDSLRALILETHPDLVVFQWTSHLAEEAMKGAGFEGWTVRRSDQFTVASRFPILSLESLGIPSGSGPPCAHAVVETPLGTLDVFAIRPQSAREELGAVRRQGLRQRIRGLFQSERSGKLSDLASFREAQIRSISQEVRKAQHPVLIAGDTNLPDGSLFLRHYFRGFTDAFSETGWGFGYTHPSRLPWMRIDRVLLGPGLDAVSVDVLGRRVSAHRPVLAEISAAPRSAAPPR